MMMTTPRANVEILVNLSLEQHLLATLALYEQAFGAHSTLFAIVGPPGLILFSEPTHLVSF